MANFDRVANFYDHFFIQLYYRGIHKQCRDFLNDFIKKDYKILDVACGTGNLLNAFKKTNKTLDLFGLDESALMINQAVKKYPDIKFFVGQAENLPFSNNYFDIITTTDAVYYFKEKEKFFANCWRTLKNGGHIFVITPTFDNFFQRLPFGPLMKLSSKIFFYNLEKDSKHLSFKDLSVMAKDNGFIVTKTGLKSFWGIKNRLIIFQKT